VRQLDALFDISGGLSASRDQLSSEGHCYLHYGDIHNSKKTFIDVRLEYQDIPRLNILLSKVSPDSLLGDGDIVFVDASEDVEGASRHIVVVNKDGIPFISGLHTIVLKSTTEELDHQYRRYCFQTIDVKRQFRFFAVGTKVTGISKTNIAKIMLPLPPLPEQTAIATILSDMDAEIAALEEKLTKARQVKQGMMQELLNREDTIGMNYIGHSERETQNRIISLFHHELRYDYLGNWIDREGNSNIADQHSSAQTANRSQQP